MLYSEKGRKNEKEFNWNYDGGKKIKIEIVSNKRKWDKFYQCDRIDTRTHNASNVMFMFGVEWIIFVVFVATYWAPISTRTTGGEEKESDRKCWTWQSKSVSGHLKRGQYGMWYQSNIECQGLVCHTPEIHSFPLTFRLDYIKIQSNWEKSISYKFARKLPKNWLNFGPPLITIKLAMISPSAWEQPTAALNSIEVLS